MMTSGVTVIAHKQLDYYRKIEPSYCGVETRQRDVTQVMND